MDILHAINFSKVPHLLTKIGQNLWLWKRTSDKSLSNVLVPCKQAFFNDMHVDKLHNQYDLQYKFNIYQA